LGQRHESRHYLSAPPRSHKAAAAVIPVCGEPGASAGLRLSSLARIVWGSGARRRCQPLAGAEAIRQLPGALL